MALHSAAAKVIDKVFSRKASLKTCVYESEWRSKSVLTAVVTETLKFKDALEEVIDLSQIRKKEKVFSKLETPWLLHVLLYELLIGRKKSLKGKTAYEKALLKHKTSIAAEWARLKVGRKAKSDAEMASTAETTLRGIIETVDGKGEKYEQISLPRYVRVNTIKATTEDVVKEFVERGFTHLDTPSSNEEYHLLVSKLGSRCFLRDFHMPDFLLVFPNGTAFHDCPLYKNGTLILQDKASCLPPFVLQPAPGCRIIDACAAPGNKTTLLAAIMRNQGHVTAFDISLKRSKLMKQMTSKAGALITGEQRGCVEIRNEDFLATDPQCEKLKSTEYIVVDPSCSGSGIQTRLNHLTDDSSSASPQRLLQLRDFQYRALTHALSFPRVRRVVYSTCSVHAEENEVVVAKALERSRVEGWGFRLTDALPKDGWKTRGRGSPTRGEGTQATTTTTTIAAANVDDLADSSFHLDRCLRASPETDLTNGFFVALFERDTDVEWMPDDEEEEAGVSGDDSDEYREALDNQSRKRRKKREKKKRKKFKDGC